METIKRRDGFRYREKVYFGNKAIKSPMFRTKSEANRWKRNTLQERDKMNALGIDQFDSRNFGEYSKDWIIKKSDKEKKTIEGYQSILTKHLLPRFQNIKMTSLRPMHGDQLKTDLVQNSKLSKVRINHILKVLKMIANDAVKSGAIIRSPFLNLEYLKVQAKARTYWLPNEVQKFLSCNQSDFYYPLYCFMLNTGVRPCEARGLKWDKVDFTRGIIEISRSQDRHGLKETTKSKKPRNVPMNKIIRDFLMKQRQEKASLDYVFPQPSGEAFSMHLGDRIFPNAIKRAGVRRIQLRHLRSTFASNFVMNGGDIFSLSKLLGHHSVQVTEQRYADLHPNYLQKEAEIVNFSAVSSPHLALVGDD